MGNKIKIAISLMALAGFYSCELDLSGLIRSNDRVEDRFVQSVEYNDLHPIQNVVVAESNYSIVVASDLHVGGTQNTEKLFNMYDSSDDDAMVLVGDLVSGKREDYEVFKSLTDSVEKPLFLMAGNHDLYFDGWKSYYEFFGSSTYYFTVTSFDEIDLFICLDSGGGTFGKSQMDWLENVLETQRSKYRHCVVFSHVNMIRTRRTTSANTIVEETAYLIDLFTKNRVDMVINGHDHVQDAAKLGNTTYLITDAVVDSYEDAGYVLLSVDENSTGYEFVRF